MPDEKLIVKPADEPTVEPQVCFDDQEADIGGFTPTQLKRNMLYCIMLDVIWTMGWADFSLALQPLLVYLKASNTIIGIVSGATFMGLFGMFVTPWISRRFRYKKWYLIAVNIPYIGAIGAVGLVVVMSHGLHLPDPTVLKMVCGLILLHMFCAGFVALPHQEYVAACIPASHRGRLTGVSISFGSLLAIGSSAVGGIILVQVAKPMAFGYLFLMTWAICQGGYVFAAFAKERPTPVECAPKPWTKDMLIAVWHDIPYVRYLTAWSAVTLLFMIVAPFTIVYALRVLKLPVVVVAVGAIINQVVRTALSAPAGAFVDKVGAKRVMPYWPAGLSLGIVAILVFPNIWGLYASTAISAITLVFASTAYTVLNYGLPSPENRAGHYTIQLILFYACVALGPMLGGVICDAVPYRTVFMAVAVTGFALCPFVKHMVSVLKDDSSSYE